MRCEEHISQSGSSPVWLPGLSLSLIKEPSNNLPNEETNCVAVLPSTMILLDRASLASPVANCRFRRLHFTTRTLMELAFQIPSLPPADFCKRFPCKQNLQKVNIPSCRMVRQIYFSPVRSGGKAYQSR